MLVSVPLEKFLIPGSEIGIYWNFEYSFNHSIRWPNIFVLVNSMFCQNLHCTL